MALEGWKLPRDWYERFGHHIKRIYVTTEWECWPSWHRHRGICQWRFFDFNRGGSLIGEVPCDISLLSAYHYYDKTAMLYRLPRDRQVGNPNRHEAWIHDVYKTWAEECLPHERLDARFVFAPFGLSKADPRLAWIKFGADAGPTSEADLAEMISWHIRWCNVIEDRAARTPTAHDLWEASESGYIEGAAKNAKAWHSALTPTFRAVFVVWQYYMSRCSTSNVLLVLTGHNQDMKSRPPSLQDLDSKDIISWRSHNVVEVSLKTATRYLHRLEWREEASNEQFRARNQARKQAIHRAMEQEAWTDIEYQRGKTQDLGGLDDSGNFPLSLPSFFQTAWTDVVADELALDVLVETQDLRSQCHLDPW